MVAAFLLSVFLKLFLASVDVVAILILLLLVVLRAFQDEGKGR